MDRLDAIRKIVSASRVSDQGELIKALKQRGIHTTQATLSRDMKALGIVKMHDAEFGYSYRMPYAPETERDSTLKSLSTEGVLSIEFSASLAVVKTRPGYASVIGAVIDASHPDSVMGTIAGDDTVLLVIREAFSRLEVIRSLSVVLPGIEHMIKQ